MITATVVLIVAALVWAGVLIFRIYKLVNVYFENKTPTLPLPAAATLENPDDVDFSFLTADLDEALGNTERKASEPIVISDPVGKEIRLKGRLLHSKEFIPRQTIYPSVYSLYKSDSGKYVFKCVEKRNGTEVAYVSKNGRGIDMACKVFSNKSEFEREIFGYLADQNHPYLFDFFKEVPEFEHLAYRVVD